MAAGHHAAYFLVGPTAVGKTAVAHELAQQLGLPVLSVDSMQVYRGMDIGTAKPTAMEQQTFRYAGLDLVEPDADCSAAAYLAGIAPALDAAAFSRGCVAVGGSGLYVRCLIEGLSEQGDVDPVLRARFEAMFAAGGVAALQEELRRVAPDRLAALADPQNPRRLVRALETAHLPISKDWKPAGPGGPTIVGLAMERGALERRIAARVEAMYAAGLLDEARSLRTRCPALSRTSAQAIGYAEAFSVLDGKCSLREAKALTVVRTRQLAKKQMTWFRRQHVVEWIEVAESDSVAAVADRVHASWQRHGPVRLHD